MGEERDQRSILRRLVELQYERNDFAFARNKFRVRGDTIEVFPAYEERAVRIQLFGDEVERIVRGRPAHRRDHRGARFARAVPGVALRHRRGAPEGGDRGHRDRARANGSPSSRASSKLLEAQRLRMRTTYDLEMLREVGSCSGVENYSMHLDGRVAASAAVHAARLLPRRLAAASSTSRTSRSRSCTASSRVTVRGRRRWSSTGSGCRRRWTTGRCASRSSPSA